MNARAQGLKALMGKRSQMAAGSGDAALESAVNEERGRRDVIRAMVGRPSGERMAGYGQTMSGFHDQADADSHHAGTAATPRTKTSWGASAMKMAKGVFTGLLGPSEQEIEKSAQLKAEREYYSGNSKNRGAVASKLARPY